LAVRERVLTIEGIWIKTRDQIEFLGQIWDTLNVDFQEHLEQVLDLLASKLQTAWAQVQRVERKKQMFQE
jgi:hypothetical protein